VTATPPPPYAIEPFDGARHNRADFACGIVQVDNYFKKTASKLAKADYVRLYVMTAADGALIGFYALNAHAVDYRDLPTGYARSRPRHGSIPAAYLSMIGRDRRYAGRGFGGDLLVDALRRIDRAADALGIAVVMLDVLDCGDPERVSRRKGLYERYGFLSLPSNPLRMFMPLKAVRAMVQRIDHR
jgi:ribosomal protein S18 acetylase RimI-like enzyme